MNSDLQVADIFSHRKMIKLFAHINIKESWASENYLTVPLMNRIYKMRISTSEIMGTEIHAKVPPLRDTAKSNPAFRLMLWQDHGAIHWKDCVHGKMNRQEGAFAITPLLKSSTPLNNRNRGQGL